MSAKHQRNAYVVKSNDLIQKSRFSLTLVEQRIILFLASKIDSKKPSARDILDYDFDAREFCEVCGIEYYQNVWNIKKVIQGLSNKSLWMPDPKNSEKIILIRWIDSAIIDLNTGRMTINLSRSIMPYLTNLHEKFSQYQYKNVLVLSSSISIRFYELFKSYEYIGSCTMTITELRKSLLLEKKYRKTSDFTKYVIKKSIDEINEVTDISVSYEALRRGRFVVAFRFTIDSIDSGYGKSTADEVLEKRDEDLQKKHSILNLFTEKP